MKIHHRLVIFLLLALLLTCILSPWMAAGADWMFGHRLDWATERYPFGRIFNRTFMVSGLILFAFCRRLLKIGTLADLGLPREGRALRDVATGWWLAFGSMVALVAVMTLAGIFTPFFRLSLAESLRRCVNAFFGGLFVGVLEEIFFRGILFKGLLVNGRPARAFLFANLFYSAIHFVKPGERYFMDEFDPWAGFRHLAYTFSPFLEPVALLPGIFGLLLIGWVLSYAFYRAGTLYLSVGLHAGWIFSLKTIRVFGDYGRDDLGWLFGSTDPKIVSGAAAWLGLVLVALIVHRITRPRRRLVAGPPSVTS